MTKAKWAVEIQKTSLEIRNLKDLLEGLGFRVLDELSYPVLTSEKMDACTNAADAFEMAKHLRNVLKGPAQIDTDFQLGSVIDYSSNPPKRHAFLEVKSCVMRLTSQQVTVSVGPPNGLSATEREAWHEKQAEKEYQSRLDKQRARLEPAYRSNRAVKVMKLLLEEAPTGETLYKIYELAEGHPGNREEFHKQFKISKEMFMRFKDAIHNPTVSGDWARHAYDSRPGSDKPLSKSEAERFVREIAAQWLDYIRRSRDELE